MSADDLAVVSNKFAISVNQDWAGFAGDMLNYSQYPPINATEHNVTQVPQLSVYVFHNAQSLYIVVVSCVVLV